MSDSPITEAQIKEFAAAWYQALDQHVPSADNCRAAGRRRAGDDLPGEDAPRHGGFPGLVRRRRLFRWRQGPGVINIFFDENHNVASVAAKIAGDRAEVDVVVAWQASWFRAAAAKASEPPWTPPNGGCCASQPRITSGLRSSATTRWPSRLESAPGFARL